ncbi:MAG: hypothetical protein EOO06_13400 [Chitinophagaceae bacterium]|nr:MAG: hypothetical protein EOO06_13400 [Chitinophagaceae bacterium]
MNITTDIEEINRTNDTPIHTEETALQGIKTYFREALQELEPEISAAEAECNCRIIINIMPPMEEWKAPVGQSQPGLSVTLEGYSEALSLKIQQALMGVMDASRDEDSPE